MNNRALMVLGIVLGVVFFVVGYIYITHPAGQLPSYFPGFSAGVTIVHTKHAIAAFIVGAACLVYTWFASAPKKA